MIGNSPHAGVLTKPRTARRADLWPGVAICISALASVGIVLVALAAPRAFAQGCAMCYQNAAASAPQARAALRHGILILLIPALTLFIGVFGLMYRRRTASR